VVASYGYKAGDYVVIADSYFQHAIDIVRDTCSMLGKKMDSLPEPTPKKRTLYRRFQLFGSASGRPHGPLHEVLTSIRLKVDDFGQAVDPVVGLPGSEANPLEPIWILVRQILQGLFGQIKASL
jgi:hypothetical protein